MSIKEAYIAELKNESALTRKILDRVPMDNKEWRPHEKSMTIGRLATHIAEIPFWISRVINSREYDFSGAPFTPYTASTKEELLGIFQKKCETALADLENTSDVLLQDQWVFRKGDFIISQSEKTAAIRKWAFSHLIHHRGQLSVYLRLLNVPVPGIYGPSAEER